MILAVISLSISTSSAVFFQKYHPSTVLFQAPQVSSSFLGGVKSPVTRVRQLAPSYQATSSQSSLSGSSQLVQSTSVQNEVPVQVPVITSHDVQIVPVTVEVPPQRTQVVSVEPSGQSVHLVFKSASSPLSIQQQHVPSERTVYETTRTEEQPHVIRHEVFKPVVQELRETIQPYRHVTQEIKPVLEKVSILVPKGLQQQTLQQNQQQQVYRPQQQQIHFVQQPASGSFGWKLNRVYQQQLQQQQLQQQSQPQQPLQVQVQQEQQRLVQQVSQTPLVEQQFEEQTSENIEKK